MALVMQCEVFGIPEGATPRRQRGCPISLFHEPVSDDLVRARPHEPEQTVLLIVDARGEIQRIRVAARATVPESQSPQPFKDRGFAVGVMEQAEEIAAV